MKTEAQIDLAISKAMDKATEAETKVVELEKKFDTLAAAIETMTTDRLEDLTAGWPGFMRHRKLRNKAGEPVDSKAEGDQA